jgi:DtxR family Mn-dependent transcriptional regulator
MIKADKQDSIFLTPAEQEHLKQIYLHTGGKTKNTHTNELAVLVNTKPSSVTDMIRKLATKELVIYDKHHGCRLSEKGFKEALQIIRRNRLWDLFLFDKLLMDWKEIDQIASKLQSLTSIELTEKLSAFLGHPTYDPHGEAIPYQKGGMPKTDSFEVYDLKLNEVAIVFGYRDTSPNFLKYIEKLNLLIGRTIKIISIIPYDNSLEVIVDYKYPYILTKEIAQKVYVKINGK